MWNSATSETLLFKLNRLWAQVYWSPQTSSWTVVLPSSRLCQKERRKYFAIFRFEPLFQTRFHLICIILFKCQIILIAKHFVFHSLLTQQVCEIKYGILIFAATICLSWRTWSNALSSYNFIFLLDIMLGFISPCLSTSCEYCYWDGLFPSTVKRASSEYASSTSKLCTECKILIYPLFSFVLLITLLFISLIVFIQVILFILKAKLSFFCDRTDIIAKKGLYCK